MKFYGSHPFIVPEFLKRLEHNILELEKFKIFAVRRQGKPKGRLKGIQKEAKRGQQGGEGRQKGRPTGRKLGPDSV
jgi:hypothetical protein